MPSSKFALPSAHLWALVVAVLVWYCPALAAEPAAGDGETATAGQSVQDQARLLADLLRDEPARAQLIDQLLRIAAADAGGGTAAAGAGSASTTSLGEVSIARQVALYTQEVAESLGGAWAGVETWLAEMWAGLTAGDAQLRRLSDAAIALVGIIAATMVIYVALGMVARGAFAWLAGHARGAGWLKTALLLGASSLIDALVIVVAWAGGYALALYGLGDAGRMDVRQSMYLNAFLLVELAKVGLRFALAPRYGDLRLIPLPDLLANYWHFWLSRIVGLVGYGMLLVVPIVGFNVSPRAGDALQYLIGLTALVMAIVVVLQNRDGLRGYLETRATAANGDVTARFLRLLARGWHLLAIGYCVALFGMWVVRPEDALAFMLQATAESVVEIVLGVLVGGLITRAVTGGLRLPEEIKLRLPLLETRLNAFVPAVLQVVRLLVLLAVMLLIARAWGLFDVVAWAATAAGQDVVARALGVAFILLVAALLWLALSSWVEYRLNPNVGRAPGPRERTLLALLRNAATIAIAAVTVMLVLSEIGVNIGPLLAGAGVLGLAIGFGAQKLVQDIITGVFIQFENAINEGEVVTAAGLTGVVERLTIRSVGLRDLQGVYHLIPFSSVDTVSNFMRGFAYHVAEIGIAYRENVDEARALMHEAFDELVQDPERGAAIIGPLDWHGLTTFGDSAIVLRARIKTQPGQQWAVGRAYNAIIKRLFDAHGIEIPFPHMTLYFGQDKDGSAAPLRAMLEPAPATRQPAALVRA